MEDLRFGTVLRAARLRRGWRQADLATMARSSTATISRVERGDIEATAIGTIRRIAAALEVRVALLPRSRAADLDRLVSSRHAALAEAVIGRLRAGDWVVRPEVSFSVYGERGVIDILAWHPPSGRVLVVELKTDVIDIGELLGTLDRKVRLGGGIARGLGWQPRGVSAWLAIAESMTNRRRVVAHRRTFDAVLPDDGRRLRRWLAAPSGDVHALTFVTDGHGVNVRSAFATLRRVPSRPGPAARPRPVRAPGSQPGSRARPTADS